VTPVPANPRVTVPLLAAATFFAGFGVAELTDVRALGGVALIAGGAWCGHVLLPVIGARMTLGLLAVALLLFVVSHPLGRLIGAWPAVAMSALLIAIATIAVIGRTGPAHDAFGPGT
jgi:hypothetical protein